MVRYSRPNADRVIEIECQGERPGTVCPRVDLASTRDIHNAGVYEGGEGGREMYVVIYIYIWMRER